MKTISKLKDMVIVTEPFNGTTISYIDKAGNIHGSEAQSFEVYKSSSKIKLQVVTWDRFYELHDQFYNKPFTKIPKKEYENLLKQKEKIVRHSTLLFRYDIFFSHLPSSPDSALYHDLYLFDRRSHLYFKACKQISLSNADILHEIEKEL